MDKIYNKYKKRLRNTFYTWVKNKNDLDELINDTFLRFDKTYDSSQSGEYTFLVVILKSMITQYNRDKKDFFVESDELYDIEYYDYEYDYEYEENKNKLRNEIFNLKKYREEAIMYFIEHYSIEEISNELKINTNTLKTRITSIKKTITKNLC